MRRRFWLLLPLLSLAGALQAQAPLDLPQQAASAQPAEAADYQVLDFDWQDKSRQREVPVRLYWPAQAASAAVPLVVFSHGLGGSRQGYSYLGRYWASQGYASLHVQHVGSDRRIWTGNVFSLIGRLQDAAKESEALDRVRDMRFALDRLLAAEQGAHIDRQRIVAAGHSYGATTSLLLAGARPPDAPAGLQDERIRAAIIISAPPFYGQGAPEPILAPVRVPTLHVTATEDVINVPGYHSEAGDRLSVFEATGGQRKRLAVFTGGSHSIFTDRAGTGGVTLNPQVKAATRELTLAFLSSVFEGREEGLQSWHQRWKPLLARWQ
ncbi:alpha/beta fold hydrolase [Pelomonas sp. SE-A7]|uniref:alpha/beta hydrolase family protein n=1 Tax=Pelomonas sp. SE-A7 TaxID=3054953 RepID=UPI00259D1A0F|nr:alpha/beta fold hydrolase [Pelomonas sp. SE-A7]MDM4767615.1 alpha/beta fold hydrolase [Pelomonas sp. SE-A7]